MMCPVMPMGYFFRIGMACTFALFGLFIVIPSFKEFHRANTTTNPIQIEKVSTLVTIGIYHYSRNPSYLSLAAVLVGWAFLLATLYGFLGPFLFVLFITRFQIIPEERVLRLKFGQEYDEYCQHVRRWI